MKDRPILFSAPMVRAILEGRKTMTRRVCKPLSRTPADGVERMFAFFEGKVWASVRAEEVSAINRGITVWGGEVHSIGGQSYTPVVVGRGDGKPLTCPYGQPGDRLWVRETWCVGSKHDAIKPRDLAGREMTVVYRAGGSAANQENGQWEYDEWPLPEGLPPWLGKWRQSIFMPRWASRITLKLVSIRAERLQEITEEDAVAEGFPGWYSPCHPDAGSTDGRTPVEEFRETWDALNAKRGFSFESNPWVFVISFRRVES